MSRSIVRAEREVQEAFERARGCVQGAEARTLTEVEAELWSALLAVGRALIVLFLARQVSRPRASTYKHDGVRYALDVHTRRSSELGTRFGKVRFARPIGRPIGGRSKADLPVDRELGLCSGFSLGTVTVLVQLCTLMAFSMARRIFAGLHQWAPSPRATLRMVDAAGVQAREFLDEATVAEQDGQVLVIEVDGRGAPMIRTTEYERRCRPKRRPGYAS